MEKPLVKIISAPIGRIVVDSLPFSQSGTPGQAVALKADGVFGVAGYLGVISYQRVLSILDAEMGFWAVTTAGQYDGGMTVKQMQGLSMPRGATAFLDVEGLAAFHADIPGLTAKINAWGRAVKAAGFIPGLYVGVPQPFTSDELWKLYVQVYWKGQGSVRDRNNALAEPTKCGFSVSQMYPSVVRASSVLVDVNIVGQDYLGRTPTMVIA